MGPRDASSLPDLRDGRRRPDDPDLARPVQAAPRVQCRRRCFGDYGTMGPFRTRFPALDRPARCVVPVPQTKTKTKQKKAVLPDIASVAGR